MAGTIDRTSKVNLSILGVLLATAAAGSFHLSALNTSVHRMDATLQEVKISLDRIDAQIVNDGKTIVIVVTQVQDILRRVSELESKHK